jgi:transcriptional regulator with XRE-family HTH domain
MGGIESHAEVAEISRLEELFGSESGELLAESLDDFDVDIDARLEALEVQSDSYGILYDMRAIDSVLNHLLTEGEIREELEGTTQEERYEIFGVLRETVQSLENQLTEFDSLQDLERDAEGNYVSENVFEEADVELDLNDVDNNIELYYAEIDELETEYTTTEAPTTLPPEVEEEVEDEVTEEVERAVRTATPGQIAAGATAVESGRRTGVFASLTESFDRIASKFREIGDKFQEMWDRITGSLFGNEDDPGRYAESREPINIDPSLIDTTYDLQPSEVAHLNTNERRYAEIIAEYGGLPPARIEALHNHDRLDHLRREDLYKYVSEMVEACAVVEIPMDVGLPLMISMAIMESGMDPSSVNSSQESDATGLFQFMPNYWVSRRDGELRGDFYNTQELLEQYGVIDSNVSESEARNLIFDSRVQSFVAAARFKRWFSSLDSSLDWRNYGEHRIARDNYLMHNSGIAHRWIRNYLDGQISTAEFEEMYENRYTRNGNQYSRLPNGEEVRFENYAYRRAHVISQEQYEYNDANDVSLNDSNFRTVGRPPARQSWNRVQAWYTEVKEILYGRQ